MKRYKIGLLIILLCGSFLIGYIVSSNVNQINRKHDIDTNSTHISTSESSPKGTIPFPKEEASNLSAKDHKFLEEHVYGYWEINRRIFALEEVNDYAVSLSSNISDEGVKKLIGSEMYITEKSISHEVSRISSVAYLKNPVDIYLLGLYGIFNKIVNPVYEISEVNTKDLIINNKLFNNKSPIDIFDSEKVIKVSYGLGETDTSKPFVNIEVYDVGGTLYITDPKDKDTLYIDLCGIWELKRTEIPDNTNGKSLYGF